MDSIEVDHEMSTVGVWAIRIIFWGGLGLICWQLGWWTADRTPPTDMIERIVETPQVPQGGTLRVRAVFVPTKNCQIHADRFLIDRTDAIFPILPPTDFAAGNAAIGLEESYVTRVHIPKEMALGPATYRAITTYWCNPIHHIWPITREPQDVRFEVVEGPVVWREGDWRAAPEFARTK